jgi:hypothetical protein
LPSVDVLLVHPPAVKPAEPPLGTAVLLSHLLREGFSAAAIDANLGAYLHLLGEERLRAAAGEPTKTCLRRAVRHAPRALSFLRSPAAAGSFPRYVSAVRHLNGALSGHRGVSGSERLTLGDYTHGRFSEFSPADLERVASGEEETVFTGYYREILLPEIEESRPGTVAISIHYRHQVLPAFELAGRLRRRLPSARILGGGGMLTSWRKGLRAAGLRFSPFHAVGFGPGETVLSAAAAGALPAGEPFLEGGEEVAFLPDYGFAQLPLYMSPEPVLPVAASRGCYWRKCAFCPEAVSPIHAYRGTEAPAFPALLRSLSRRYGVSRFHLTDDAIPPAVLRAMADRRDVLAGLAWHGFARFEPALRDPGFVSDLAAAGCAMLQLGLESGSQRLLDRMGKGTRVADASSILANLSRAGIAAYVYVMLGAPGEGRADAENTAAFLAEHAGEIAFLNLSILNLPREASWAGGPDRGPSGDEALGGGTDPLGLYRPVPERGGWGRAQARRFLQKELLGHPSIRAIAGRTPPWFTSNHAPFFRTRPGWRPGD